MASTYEPIATTTLSSATSSITFSSIPSTYTDLRIVWTGTTSAGNNVRVQFNGDTATNYSTTNLYGDGTTAGSSAVTSTTWLQCFNGSTSTTIPTMFTADIFSYAGSTYKTALLTAPTDKNGSGAITATVGLWRSTSAITSISLVNAANYQTGTTATLYGIKAA